MRVVSIALGAAVVNSARAGVADELAELDSRVGGFVRFAGDIERRAGSAGQGALDTGAAAERFADSVYAEMIGEHKRAAEGFFSLVTSGSLAGTDLQADVEWSFAESLFEMEDFETAEVRYSSMAEDSAHPFRVASVRRLLDLYATNGRSDRFYKLFEKEILGGRIAATPQITYAVGKNFYWQADFTRAKSYLLDIGPGTTWYLKGRYLLGTIAVREKDLAGALVLFTELAGAPALTTEDREVVAHGRLASARVQYELGEFLSAAESYSLVVGAPTLLADQLYESIWTWIRLEDWESALRGVEVFSLGYPQHAYTARLRLLVGHLQMNQRNAEAALASYDQVVRDYTPVQQRFSDLAVGSQGPSDFFRQAAAFGLDGAVIEGVPSYATAMMLDDPEFARAVGSARDLQNQAEDLARAEQIVRELRLIVDHQATLTSFEQMSFSIAESQVGVLDAWGALLGVHETVLKDGGVSIPPTVTARREALAGRVGEARTRVAQVRAVLDAYDLEVSTLQVDISERAKRVRSLEDDLAVVRAAQSLGSGVQLDASSVVAEIDRESEQLRGLERQLGDKRLPDVVVSMLSSKEDAAIVAEMASLQDALLATGLRTTPVGKQIDGLYNAIAVARARFVDVGVQVAQLADSKLALVRSQLDRLAADVEAERAQFTRLDQASSAVGVGLARRGFVDLADFFGDALLRADTGVVDVYWSQMIDTEAEIERNLNERNLLLGALDDRYRQLRTRVAQ